MGGCHGSEGPRDDGENGSVATSYADGCLRTGCCAVGTNGGGNLLRGACSNALRCKDAEREPHSPNSGQIQDAHKEVIQGSADCSSEFRRKPIVAATSEAFNVNDDGMIVAEGSCEVWHGAGVLSWPDGRRYIGQFCHGVFEGEATMTWPDGRRYIGQYRQNKKHGEGDFLWRDGRRYSGQWSDGVRHGHGIYTNARGEKRAGTFHQDRPVSWVGEVFGKETEPEATVPEAKTTDSLLGDLPEAKMADTLTSSAKDDCASPRCLAKEARRRGSPTHGGA